MEWTLFIFIITSRHRQMFNFRFNFPKDKFLAREGGLLFPLEDYQFNDAIWI